MHCFLLHIKELPTIYSARLLVIIHFEMKFALLLFYNVGMRRSDFIDHSFLLFLLFVVIIVFSVLFVTAVSSSVLLQEPVMVVLLVIVDALLVVRL